MIQVCTISHTFQLARVSAELFFRGSTEYQSLDFLGRRRFGAIAHHDDHDETEKEHPAAEEQPVEIIEKIFEKTVARLGELSSGRIVDFGSGDG